MANKILQLWNERNISALELLHEHYYGALLQYTYTLSHNIHDAKDLVNEAFIKVWLAEKQFRKITSLRNYLFTTALNLHIDEIRKARRTRFLFGKLQHQVPSQEDIQESIILAEMHKNVADQLQHLPPKGQLIFKMTLKGHTVEEIARAAQTTKNNVGNYWRRLSSEINGLLRRDGLL